MYCSIVFTSHFPKKVLVNKDYKITKEGQDGFHFYILYKGNVSIYRRIKESPNKEPKLVSGKYGLLVSSEVSELSIIGEELLYKDQKAQKYEYTAIVKSDFA